MNARDPTGERARALLPPAPTVVGSEERFLVVTLGELVEAVSELALDAAEAAAVVEHLLRRSQRRR